MKIIFLVLKKKYCYNKRARGVVYVERIKGNSERVSIYKPGKISGNLFDTRERGWGSNEGIVIFTKRE